MNPYSNQPATAFWRTGVAEQPPGEIAGLYRKRFDIPASAGIATGGSCFAQHIAQNLRKRGWSVLDMEPAPPGLSVRRANEYGYGLYSARYGNLYTTAQLLQTVDEAFGTRQPPSIVWEKDGRFFDAMRPSVEPLGLDTAEEVLAHRRDHLARVRALIETLDVFIFTLGLTEAWMHRETGWVYPTAPGVIAGAFDPSEFAWKNFSVDEVVRQFEDFRTLVRNRRPGAKFLLTVSPVPLTATASDQHVLPATIYSKSVLRAAAGRLYELYPDVDYFPSFELVMFPFTQGNWFAKNLRSVKPAGVEMVMKHFFAEHVQATAPVEAEEVSGEDVICEEAMLDAFAP